VTVAVLIVNRNGGDLLKRCLAALRKQTWRPFRTVVVDNASEDDSLISARDELDQTELIRLPTNAGFARANNIAASVATDCDLYALINPDAFAEPAWLAALVDAAERHPSFSAFASQMRVAGNPDLLDGVGDSYHVSGRAWRIGHRTRPARPPTDEMEVFAPCAAAALYRRRAFESVGGFDERYFCYFEDVDLGFRLRLQGHRALYVPSAVVHHVGSGTAGYQSEFATYHGERNMVWTFFKNMPSPLVWRYLPQHLALNAASLAYYPVRGQGKVVWKAKLDALRALPAILRDRRMVQRDRRVDAATIDRALSHGVLSPYIRRYTVPLESAESPSGAFSRADSTH
jgi:GT2 family glycosyltransferase